MKLSNKIGCNLIGGLKILGFFYYSTKMSSKSADSIINLLNQHVNIIQESQEFNNPDIFIFTHTGKSFRIESLFSGQNSISFPIAKFKPANEMVSSLNIFINKTFFIPEKVDCEYKDDESFMYNVF